MIFPLFVGAFLVFSTIYVGLETLSMTGSIFTTTIKAVPAFSAVLFILFLQTPLGLFCILLALALIFCGFGDIAMEYTILPGLTLFLIAHIIFTINFIIHSLPKLALLPIMASAFVMIPLLVYIILFHRYLKTAEKPTELLPAVDVYAIVISLTLGSSLLLWLESGNELGFIPLLGAAFFIISDSLIGIREFHHRFRYDEPITMITYYLAIFLLSLAAMVYAS